MEYAVFPTHVGVNRNVKQRFRRSKRIPHARGGEPVDFPS